jgi:DNA-binding response OmpR family regulator
MERILVIAHELIRATSLMVALKLKGYTTLLATEPQEALTLAEAHHPHLAIISDNLPPSDAIHARLRARYSSEELPIILLEETISASEARLLQSAAMSTMMHFMPHKLLEKVQALTRSHDRGLSRSV